MYITTSDICTALDTHNVIGSKVIDHAGFMNAIKPIIAAHDFTKDDVPGQAVLDVPGAVPYVSCGVGQKSADPKHYVLREHRGQVSAYLRRFFAAKTERCSIVIYTKESYFKDPDVTPNEIARINACGFGDTFVTHVLVAVLASAGELSTVSPHRFVANLAGGNREALLWSGDKIREKAREINTYMGEWSMVADVPV